MKKKKKKQKPDRIAPGMVILQRAGTFYSDKDRRTFVEECFNEVAPKLAKGQQITYHAEKDAFGGVVFTIKTAS